MNFQVGDLFIIGKDTKTNKEIVAMVIQINDTDTQKSWLDTNMTIQFLDNGRSVTNTVYVFVSMFNEKSINHRWLHIPVKT